MCCDAEYVGVRLNSTQATEEVCLQLSEYNQSVLHLSNAALRALFADSSALVDC
jgi:hypothetical protein